MINHHIGGAQFWANPYAVCCTKNNRSNILEQMRQTAVPVTTSLGHKALFGGIVETIQSMLRLWEKALLRA